MSPTDIPDIPVYEYTPFVEPTTDTALLRAVEVPASAETHADDLSKVEVMNRAIQRITKMIARYGINESVISLMSVYERIYSLTPGVEAKAVTNAQGNLVAVAA